MRRGLGALLVLALLAGSAAAQDEEDRKAEAREAAWPNWGLGPIDFRNEQIISMTRLSLSASSPATLPGGETEIVLRGDWANSFKVEKPQFEVDGEVVDVALRARHGILDVLEGWLEIPFIYRSGGTLDEPIEAVEKFFGVQKSRRRDDREGRYKVAGLTDEGEPFHLRSGTGVGKISLGVEGRIEPLEPYVAASLEMLLALPTASDTFGSNGVDVGLRLALARRISNVILYAGGGVTYTPGTVGNIELYDFVATGFAAIEWRIGEHFSMVVQGWLDSTGAAEDLSGPSNFVVYFGPGIIGRIGPVRLEFGLLENGGDHTRGADKTAHALVAVQF